jgi:hypothetical protein
MCLCCVFHVNMQIEKANYVSVLSNIKSRVCLCVCACVRVRVSGAGRYQLCYGAYVAGPCWGLIDCMEQSPSREANSS